MGYHLSVGIVSRGGGKSIIAKAAYNSREKILEERTGETKDYSAHKQDRSQVIAKAAYNSREEILADLSGEAKDYTYKQDRPLFSGIFAGKDAPEWVQDRTKLWNEVDRREKRKDAQLAYNFIAALPHQLTDQQREFIVKDFAREQFMRRGVVADVHIHAPDPKGDDRNFHVHMLVTMREITPDGFGDRVLEWKDRDQNLKGWREKWAERGARELEKAGLQVEADRWRVGHLDIEKQRQAALDRGDLVHAEALDREPTKHRGPQVDAMERRGPETERGNSQRDTLEYNAAVAGLKNELAGIEKEIAAEQQRQAELTRQNIGRAAHETTERIAAPDDLNRTAGAIWEAYQRSDNPRSFVAALQDQGMILAHATKEDVRASQQDSFYAKQQGKHAPVLREGELVIINDRAQAYRLTPRTTGDEWRELREFMGGIDRKALGSVTAAKETMQDRAEAFDLERQAFRDLSSVGLLKQPEKDFRPTGPLGVELAGKKQSPIQPKNTVSKLADGLISLLGSIFDMLCPPSPRTPEQARADNAAAVEAAADREIDLARFRSDADYRRFIQAREAEAIDREREQRQAQQKERERQR